MIVAQPDWTDVLQRAAHARRRSFTVRAIVVAALALVLAAPALGLGVGGWLDALEPGHAVPPSQMAHVQAFSVSALGSAEAKRILSGHVSFRLREVTRSGPETFYVLQPRAGLRCYGDGPTGSKAVLSVVGCPSPAEFPSAAHPILDLSTWSLDDGLRIAAGIAVDGVRSVGLIDANGRVVARVRVTDNVFARRGLPYVASGRLVAFDAAGRRMNEPRASVSTGCTVRVYFDPDADAKVIGADIAVARTLAHVRSLTFVSKAAALTQMRRQYPALTTNLHVNPLPSSLTIVPASRYDVAGIVAALRAKRLADVVKIASCC